METIALITAIPLERDALLRCMPGWQRASFGSSQGHCIDLPGRLCCLVVSGMGTRRAGDAAGAMIAASAPRMLISFGIAGAVEADLRVGDVVLAEAVCALEGGVPGPLQPLAALPAAAREAAARAAASRGAQVWTGTALTTGGMQPREGQRSHLPHPILEMETAGIAQVAAESDIPLVSIRAISDSPCAPVPVDIAAVMDGDANLNTGRLLGMALRQPRIFFQIPRLLRNARLAADNAALAVAAVLRSLTI